MKTAILKGRRDVQVEDVPLPSIGNGDLLVKMRACGVCGTDVEKMAGEAVTPPMLGHEVVGEIADLGENVATYRKGDRVFVHHHVPCYVCYYCRQGDYTMCEDFSRTSIYPSGFSEFFKVPEINVQRRAVLKLPSDMQYEEAVFIEPMGCCIRALRKLGIRPGDSVAVFGTGATGILHVQLAHLFGASMVIAADISDSRLEVARKLGADYTVNLGDSSSKDTIRSWTEGRGPDCIVVGTGNVRALLDAIETVRKGGRVLLFGAPPRGSQITYDASNLFIREITFLASYSTTELETNMALELLQRRRLSVMPLITHRFPLNKILDALLCAEKGGTCIKPIVQP